MTTSSHKQPPPIRYGSVCAGIEAATAAWSPLGWEAQWFSEIEPFPCAVLAHHYPQTPNLGDMTKLYESDTFQSRPIDLLVGGTPCQGFSVAGLRGGLDDQRSNLALEFIRLAATKRPRRVLWENVPGVFSTNGGRDFAAFLAGLTGRDIAVPKNGWRNAGIVVGIPDAYSLAWRVLDAQYFGLAQRRRRVFVVGCLGDWRGAAAVLFERDSLWWNPPPSRQARQETPRAVAFSAGNSDKARSIAYTEEGTPPLRAGASGTNQVPTVAYHWATDKRSVEDDNHQVAAPLTTSQYADNESQESKLVVVRHNTPFASTGDISHCLNAGGMKRQDYETETFIVQPAVFDPNQITSKTNRSRPTPGLSHTLPASSTPPVVFGIDEECNVSDDHFGPLLRGGQGGTRQPVAYRTAGDGCVYEEGDATAPLTTNTDRSANVVAFQERGRDGGRSLEVGGDVAYALTAPSGGSRSQEKNILDGNMAVRRLTPTECERLQGFPDGYTKIQSWNGWRLMHKTETPEQCIADGMEVKQNKKTGKYRVKDVDGPRYKALGNSIAVPVLAWIGRRIQLVDSLMHDQPS